MRQRGAEMMHRNLNVTVKIFPQSLIDALIKNKLRHQEDYAKAVKVWLPSFAADPALGEG